MFLTKRTPNLAQKDFRSLGRGGRGVYLKQQFMTMIVNNYSVESEIFV